LKIFNNKSGFTLIELLVVISILSVLGYIAMADYNGEIKRNRVRIAQETVYSELQDLRVRVASGEQNEDVFRCFGLEVTLDSVSRVSAPYDSGCDYNEMTEDEDLKIASSVPVLSIDDGALSGAYIFFVPPYGDMEIFNTNMLPITEETTIVLGHYGYEKSVLINPLTGNIALNETEE